MDTPQTSRQPLPLRKIWEQLWTLLKMSRKYLTSSSGSNWMLGVIPERIENNWQETIMSPFEPILLHVGIFNKDLAESLQKIILEDKQF